MLGAFMIFSGIATIGWYGYHLIYDLYFAGKGTVSAVTIEEKEVDIQDEIKGFRQFGIDGYVKAEPPPNDRLKPDASSYHDHVAASIGHGPPTGIPPDNSSGTTTSTTTPKNALHHSKSSNTQSQSSSQDSDDNDGDNQQSAIEIKFKSREAEKYGDEYDSFREQIEGTSFSGGVDPDNYQSMLDDMEHGRNKLAELYITPVTTAA